MSRRRILTFVGIPLLVAALGVGGLWGGGILPGTIAQAQMTTPTLEWFGWSHFRITSAEGKVIIIHPFITGNPDSSVTLDDIAAADLILVSDGHRDEQGDTIAIAQKTGATVIAGGFELGSWFMQKGIPSAQVIRSNPGNFHEFGKITVRVVNSVHGSGLPAPTIENPYGGPAAGFFITLENGFTVYFAASTAATMDMQMWASAFRPDLAILPLNGNRDPMDIRLMAQLLTRENSNLRWVIPHHQRVEPPAGATTVDQMEKAVSAAAPRVAVVRMQPGDRVLLAR